MTGNRPEADATSRTPRSSVTAVVSALRLVARAAGVRAGLAALAFQVVGALAAVGLVLAGKRTLEVVLAPAPTVGALLPALGLLAIASAVGAAALAWQGQQHRLIAEDASALAWRRLLAVTGRVDLETVESPAFADRVGRIEEHALDQPAQIASAVFGLVGAAVTVVALASTVASIQPLLLPIMVLPGVAALALTRYAGRSEFAFYRRYGELSRMRRYVRDLLVGQEFAKEVRAYDLEPVLDVRHRALSARFRAALRRQVRLRQWLALGGAAVSAAALTVTLALVAWLIASGRLDAARAGAAVIAIRLLAGQLERLLSSLGSVLEAAPFLADLEDFLATTPVPATAALPVAASAPGAPTAPAAPAAPSARGSGSVGPWRLGTALTLEDVSYRYPGAERPALNGVGVEVRRGELVALVGENGSGKSTLAKLAAGLYAPTQGRLLWDGRPLAADDLPALRAAVTSLFQDFVEYDLTVVENVDLRATDDDVRRERALRAAHALGLADLLDRLPRGADTPLGHRFDGAVDLSGGQWQRLALARALSRPADVVVLDEPSSALDARAEHALFADLRATLHGRAALLVSHRYSSLHLVDRIYVLQDGAVVEQGSHEALLARGGLYAELYRLQAGPQVPG